MEKDVEKRWKREEEEARRLLAFICDGFAADERAVIAAELMAGPSGATLAFIERLVRARRRTLQRQESDAVTDHARRVLVGARVPRPKAEQYRQCADAQGISLYRFVCRALEHERKSLI